MSKKGKIILFWFTAVLLLAGILGEMPAVQRLLWPLTVKDIKFFHIPENRLRFKVSVTTNRKSKAYLRYWTVNGKDTLYTALSAEAKVNTLFITNTVANTDYRFEVVAMKGTEVAKSKEHGFQTESIYQATPYFDLAYVDPDFAGKMKGKYFLTQILTEPGSMVIIDDRGNIVWYQPFKKGVKVTHWTPHHTVLAIIGAEKIVSSGGDEIIEVDLSGKVLRNFKVGKGDMDKRVHHEVRYDKDKNIYALTFDKKGFDLSTVGGIKRDTVHGDGIVMFNQAGKKQWEWSVLDHLDPLKDTLILKHKKDWVHANSVFRDKEGNFLISYRDLNQVWKISYPSGKVIWKFGEGGDFPLKDNELFSGQHAAHWLNDGSLLFLDNGMKKHLTRGISFVLDEQHKTASAKFIVPLGKDYFTPAKGNVSLMDTNTLMFCLTDPRSFLITDLKGKVLWNMEVGGDPYRLEEIKGFQLPEPSLQ
ncbi:aryl-sulfate sulfotransferase [Pedobacter sp. AW31-3R]|uniref:aryl-sulfate sulfotransferase n=1 Tax=Pedobacter sp. AW31-3R TaxID=3445781 RepID=UPI003FA15FF3